MEEEDSSCWLDNGYFDKHNEVVEERDAEGFPIRPRGCRYYLKSHVDPKLLLQVQEEKGLKSKEIIMESFAQSTSDTNTVSYEQLKKVYPALWEVKWLNREEVMKRIEILYRILNKQSTYKACFVQPLPLEHVYVDELNCIMTKGYSRRKCYERNGQNKRFVRFDLLLNLVYNLRSKNMWLNKRWIHYAFEELFKEEAVVDEMLNSMCLLIGCTRSNLNILSSAKGKFIGNIGYRYAEDEDYTCAKDAVQNTSELIEFMHMDGEPKGEKPKFILVVEKETIFQRLVESNFHQQYHCIIITGRGQPDISTRVFLKNIAEALKIRVLVLTDCSPFGLEIYFSYLLGSMSLSYDSRRLTTPGLKWLGVTPSDLEVLAKDIQNYGHNYGHNLPCPIKELTEADIKKRSELLEKEYVKENPKWARVLESMHSRAQLEALSSYHLNALTEVYLPKKLMDRSWI